MTDRTYTDPSVFAGIAAGADWADPVMNPEEIDWPERQARAAIPFQVVNGRPVNPCERTGIRYGRNEFGHWGEALMADALVTCTYRGLRHLLLIERGDGHGWAVPGGHVEPGETGTEAALRELAEETGLSVPEAFCPDCGCPDAVIKRVRTRQPPEEHYECADCCATWPAFPGSAEVHALAARYVPDPRASDEAWAVTVPVHVGLGDVLQRPPVTGADDARQARWLPARSYAQVVDSLRARFGGRVFAAHVDMLTGFLGTEVQR